MHKVEAVKSSGGHAQSAYRNPTLASRTSRRRVGVSQQLKSRHSLDAFAMAFWHVFCAAVQNPLCLFFHPILLTFIPLSLHYSHQPFRSEGRLVCMTQHIIGYRVRGTEQIPDAGLQLTRLLITEHYGPGIPSQPSRCIAQHPNTARDLRCVTRLKQRQWIAINL